MKVDALLSIFRRAASPPLARWLDTNAARVGKAAEKSAYLAEIFAKIEEGWARADYSIAKAFTIELFYATGGLTAARIEAARPLVEAAGFRVTPVRGTSWSAGRASSWSVLPSEAARVRHEAELAILEEAAITALDVGSLPLAIGAPDPAAFTLKHAIVAPVAGELWVFPANESRIKQRGGDKVSYTAGDTAYRIPKGTRLPEHYKRRKPPEWARILVSETLEWNPYRDFAVGPKGLSAASLVQPFAAGMDSRYGLFGYIWLGRHFAATDGQQAHMVDVPEGAPSTVMLDRRVWGQHALVARSRNKDGGFNLTSTMAVSVGVFPDIHQVLPSIPYGSWAGRYTWDKADVKVLEEAIKAVRRGGSRVHVCFHRGEVTLWWKDAKDYTAQGPPLAVRLGVPDRDGSPVYVDPRILLTALTPFRKMGLPFTLHVPTAARSSMPILQHCDGEQLQYGIMMPTGME